MSLKCKLTEVKFNPEINKKVIQGQWDRNSKVTDKSLFNSIILLCIQTTLIFLAKILQKSKKVQVVIKVANIFIKSMLMIISLKIMIDHAQLQEVNCVQLSKKARSMICLICIVHYLHKSLMKIQIIKAFLKELKLKSKLIIYKFKTQITN